MVNLFFSGMACGSGHVHRKALGIDNETLTPLNLQLYVGDISSPYNICLRRDVYNAYFEIWLSLLLTIWFIAYNRLYRERRI